MPINAEKKELLGLGLEELRRLYDSVSDGYNHLRTKALALIAGEVAIVTFLFSSDGSNRSLFPHLIYGIIFLFIGILALSIAFILFLWVLSPSTWSHPPETKMLKNIHKSFNDSTTRFLEYLKDEYIETIGTCIGKVNSKARKFVWGVYLLSVGIFILITIKYGSGTIDL